MGPELLERLKRSGDLGALPAQDLSDMLAACAWRRYSRGQTVVGQEDRSGRVFLIAEGTVRVSYYTDDGDEVGFRDMGGGEIFGEIAAIDSGARSASVVAQTDAHLGSLHPETFWRLVRERPAVAELMLRRLARLVRALSQRVVEYTTLTVRNRIHAELLRLARDHMMGDHAYIDPAPLHKVLAARISTHREAVSREITRLTREGILKKSGRALIVRDIAALELLVQKPPHGEDADNSQSDDPSSAMRANANRRRGGGRPAARIETKV